MPVEDGSFKADVMGLSEVVVDGSNEGNGDHKGTNDDVDAVDVPTVHEA